MKVVFLVSTSTWDKEWVVGLRKELKMRDIDTHEILLQGSPAELLQKIQCAYCPGDRLLTRVCEASVMFLKDIYAEIAILFGKDKIFPSAPLILYYDDKKLQNDLFTAKKYATPQTRWVESEKDVHDFLLGKDLTFPLVRKDPGGASSRNVSLARSVEELHPFPCLAQQFCSKNSYDIRIVTVGHRAFGFKRLCRPNDFRASGSGRVEFDSVLPSECVKLAETISKENDFECMAYDFVKLDNKWVVLEMSYTFVDSFLRGCKFYIDLNNNWVKVSQSNGISAIPFILDDFFSK